MNSDLEKQILKLKPEALPADLMERLKVEPECEQLLEILPEPSPAPASFSVRKKTWVWFTGASLTAAAACILVMLSMSDPVTLPDDNTVKHAAPNADDIDYQSLVHVNQTLLSRKTLATEELNGQTWELAEEKWMDETVATCSTSPVLVSAHEIRREIVFRPVNFR